MGGGRRRLGHRPPRWRATSKGRLSAWPEGCVCVCGSHTRRVARLCESEQKVPLRARESQVWEARPHRWRAVAAVDLRARPPPAAEPPAAASLGPRARREQQQRAFPCCPPVRRHRRFSVLLWPLGGSGCPLARRRGRELPVRPGSSLGHVLCGREGGKVGGSLHPAGCPESCAPSLSLGRG